VAIDVPTQRHDCRTCRAVWSEGRFTWGCDECGGMALRRPCGLCLTGCGQTLERAVMDSNDTRRAHLLGGCGEQAPLAVKAQRWLQVRQVAGQTGAPLLRLRVELIGWSSDEAWERDPRGPPSLQVLLDALLDAGLTALPRALAHDLFTWEQPSGAGLASLPLRRFWNEAGSLVLLERLAKPAADPALRSVRVVTVIGEGRSWLSSELLDEVPCALSLELAVGQRALGVLVPSNRVAGLLVTDALPVTAQNEDALVDWHRQRVAAGDPTFV
jgi:hypothetical protein